MPISGKCGLCNKPTKTHRKANFGRGKSDKSVSQGSQKGKGIGEFIRNSLSRRSSISRLSGEEGCHCQICHTVDMRRQIVVK